MHFIEIDYILCILWLLNVMYSMAKTCLYMYKTKYQVSITRDVFYVRREVDLMKTAKVNAYIMHIFGKIELLSIHAT